MQTACVILIGSFPHILTRFSHILRKRTELRGGTKETVYDIMSAERALYHIRFLRPPQKAGRGIPLETHVNSPPVPAAARNNSANTETYLNKQHFFTR